MASVIFFAAHVTYPSEQARIEHRVISGTTDSETSASVVVALARKRRSRASHRLAIDQQARILTLAVLSCIMADKLLAQSAMNNGSCGWR